MKVLRIIPTMNPSIGGPCQGIRNSIPELKKLGIENEVVSFDDPDEEFISKDPFKIHSLGKSSGPWARNDKFPAWLTSNIQQYDVVIIHGLWLYHSYAAWKVINKLGKNLRPKVYVMTHGMLDPWFQKAEGRKLKAIRNWVYWKLIEKRVVNDADGVLFTSEQELVLAREPFTPYRPKRELNVGYGILPPPKSSQEITEKFQAYVPAVANKPFLLFLSRIDIKKGVDLLIRAYLDLRNSGTRLPALVIAGPGLDTEYGSKMVKLADGHPDIIFPGMLTGDLKWGAFYNCEAFVLPSHQENFGISVVEALACGKPVLISNQINIFNEIEHGGAGIVGPDDVEGTTSTLSRWTKLTSEDRQKMSSNALKVYQKNYSISEAAKTLKEVFTNAHS